jgi:hypothetical protein
MTEPVLALRNDDDGKLDDVVVKGAKSFRAEMMDDKTLWMACYFDDAGTERVTFYVHVVRGKLEFGVTETPSRYTDFDQQRKDQP